MKKTNSNRGQAHGALRLALIFAALMALVAVPSLSHAQDEDGPAETDAAAAGEGDAAAGEGDAAAGEVDAAAGEGDAAAGEGDAAAGEGDAAAGAGDTAAGTETTGTDGASDDVARRRTDQRLREIGNQVDALKEDTFATKSRLLLLREQVLQRSVAGAKVVVVLKNQLGSEFEIERIVVHLDRDPKWDRRDIDLDEPEKVIDEKVVPGSRSLHISALLTINSYGVFTYAGGYSIQLPGTYSFTAEEGTGITIIATLYESGSFFTALEQRPDIKFLPKVVPLDNDDSGGAL